mmetsp:Transcript_30878/g.22965  ORF Transcript_30878/g.22965 Transcript_30878/m.22965 type:complete len:80 (-) Transcript_30878:7-246(-)
MSSASAPEKSHNRQASGPKKVNVEALKSTLAGLIEEKTNLENRLKQSNLKSKDEIQFDLDIVVNNIKSIQDKIKNAQQS